MIILYSVILIASLEVVMILRISRKRKKAV
jgi:hypothetical protein